jgi:hypothetical protein
MSWLDAFFTGVTGVAAGGVLLPLQPVINFANGLTVSQSNGMTTVTAGDGSPVAGTVVSSTTTITSPSTNASYLMRAGASLTIAGTPVDGVVISVTDYDKVWQSQPFTWTGQSGSLTRNPENLAASDSLSVVLSAVNGESATWKWYAALGKWLPL